jgi:phosphatidylglycerophosphate synthase
MLPVSLDCFSSPYVLCTQCCRFLWIVCLRLMSCVPNVAGFSGLFVFILCLVYPMLPVSLDCLSTPYVLCTQCYQFLWIGCLHLMSCLPNVASFSGLSSPYNLCTHCCQFLWIVCLRLMSCVPNVASFSGLFVFPLCLVYLMLRKT